MMGLPRKRQLMKRRICQAINGTLQYSYVLYAPGPKIAQLGSWAVRYRYDKVRSACVSLSQRRPDVVVRYLYPAQPRWSQRGACWMTRFMGTGIDADRSHLRRRDHAERICSRERSPRTSEELRNEVALRTSGVLSLYPAQVTDGVPHCLRSEILHEWRDVDGLRAEEWIYSSF